MSETIQSTSASIRAALIRRGVTPVRVRKVSFADLARADAFFVTLASHTPEAFAKAKEAAGEITALNTARFRVVISESL